MGSPLTLVHEVKLCRRQLQLMALRCLMEKAPFGIRKSNRQQLYTVFYCYFKWLWIEEKNNNKNLLNERPVNPTFGMYGMMYSHDKMMMNTKPLGPTISGANCFSGRYSPTYRVPDQMRDPMRRCMTNPPVSLFRNLLWRYNIFS